MPLMHWLHPFTLSHLGRLVEIDTSAAKHLTPAIRRVLLFAAHEAKQRGSAQIDQQHLLLGALRERRNPSDGPMAAALRDALPRESFAGSRLKLSTTARQIIESASSLEDILATDTER